MGRSLSKKVCHKDVRYAASPYAQLQAFSIFEESASAQAECALTLKSVVPKRNRGFHPFRRPRLADYQSVVRLLTRSLIMQSLQFRSTDQELLHLSRFSSSDHHVESTTCPQPSPHGSTLIEVAKKRVLARIGSNRTAHSAAHLVR
jgi:hypothetical protein